MLRFLVLFLVCALWSFGCTPREVPEESVAAEPDFHADSLAEKLLAVPVELERSAAADPAAISAETRRRLTTEREKTRAKLEEKLEQSTMKYLSCQEIFDNYAAALEDCVLRDRCGDLESFDARDIAFRACRTGDWKARFDSLELRFR